MDIIEIATALIDEDTDQPRYQFDDEALQELMSSIGEIGLLSPIKVRAMPGGRYKIIYGNRRYKACKMLNKPTIPCIVSTATDEMEIYFEQIAENLTRQGFSPIEEAEAFHKLLTDPKFSSSTKYISSKLGKPESYIKNKLELLKFSNAVRKLIVAGTEIRKDKLTEDQLMPLKDLPMEHRDSLALIMARDEMAVTDVKKIAKLFKDKDISDNTKGKLLFKSGYELLETWATFEHNRKEREKAAKARAEAEEADEESKKTVAKQPAPSALQIELIPQQGQANATEPQAAAPSAASLLGYLQPLLASIPAPTPLPAELVQSIERLTSGETDQLVDGINKLIGSLEQHLAEWRAIRDAANKYQAQ
ncbi:ParB/RepB/Spo0J family partition protein [Cohnella panacarvi]|uniref:ParB/RepB/Spo0J family partition protein n=1 Tax=Cohnella panacarvi TaxID=400776 RepID=UPI00047C1DA2|nr:ParB/RepB/Spo0J family partition protein [Cohnella panacarvi]